MQIVDYKKESYLQKQRKNAARTLDRTVLVGLAILAVMFVILSFAFKYSHQPKVFWILTLPIFLLFFVTKKIDTKSSKERAIFDNWQKGEDGEKEVLEYLKQKFDDSWFYINNLKIPDLKTGDIDGLLMGPKGIFLLEIKKWNGSFRISGSDFYRHLYKDRYQLYSQRPVEQTTNNAQMLLEYLYNKKEVKTSLIPTVVLVSSHVEYMSRSQKTTVTELSQLAVAINNADSMNLTPAYIKKLIEILVYNKCPRCGGDLVRHHGQNYSDFWGCSNYKNGCLFKEEIIQAGH